MKSDIIRKSNEVQPGWFTFHTGNFFIRNCQWSLDFIKTVYNDYRFITQPDLSKHATGDEIGFTIYYMGYPEYRDKIGFLPNSLLHTSIEPYCTNPKIKQYQDVDFLIHVFYLPLEKKIEMLSLYKDRVNH